MNVQRANDSVPHRRAKHCEVRAAAMSGVAGELDSL